MGREGRENTDGVLAITDSVALWVQLSLPVLLHNEKSGYDVKILIYHTIDHR